MADNPVKISVLPLLGSALGSGTKFEVEHNGTSAQVDDLAMSAYIKLRSQTLSSGVRLLSKLRAADLDANILILGDSTGYDTCEPSASAILNPAQAWPRLVAAALAATYPKYSVIHKTAGDQMPTPPISGYGSSNGGNGATTTVQTGTGGVTLTINDGSVPGTASDWVMGSRYVAMVESVEPDLLLISYGHNEGSEVVFEKRLRTLIEEARRSWHGLPIVLVAQNWGTNTPAQKRKNRQRVLQVAAERSCDVFDMGEVIESAGGNTSTALAGDGTHLSIAGQQIVANAMSAQLFTWTNNSRAVPMLPSSLLQAPLELLNDPFFLRGIDTTFRRGYWQIPTANLTTTRDTAKYDYQFAASQAGVDASCLRLDGNGVAGEEEIRQLVEIPPTWVGKYITLTARVFRPAAAMAANRGVLIVTDSVGGQTDSGQWSSYGAAAGQNAGLDGWVTVQVTHKIPAGCTYVIARIYLAPNNTAPTAQMWVQWASLQLSKNPSAAKPLTHEDTLLASRQPATINNTVTSGSTVAMALTDEILLLRPAGTLASLTLQLPKNPGKRSTYRISSSAAITALTVQAAPGGTQALFGPFPTALGAGAGFKVYLDDNDYWNVIP